ncbi:MAG TPA: NAD-dependent epimerase/dehydratase family protein [Actinomycetota bacterium]|nr:NAD-dependent epimerase/dehydratase family protein [Actinomycetota bacterium]
MGEPGAHARSSGLSGAVALVTGAAGFVGSHLVERLVGAGAAVRAVDSLTAYYSVEQKRRTLDALRQLSGCAVIEADLRTSDLAHLVDGADLVFHQAGQPGVRASWQGFGDYLGHNVLATQRLLAAVQDSGIRRFVYASSSSVYGEAARHPTVEGSVPRPVSPYGVTKLAAEHLCGVFAGLGVPSVSLRYFTVYGPRQRPDMALHRLIDAALSGTPFPLFGDGRQVRDLTYVDDVIEANISAGATEALTPGAVLNIAGGTVTDLRGLIELVEELTGRPIAIDRRPAQPGDVRATSGSTALAAEALGWRPRVSLRVGVAEQVAWHASRTRLERSA